MSFQARITEDQRLVILRALAEDSAGYELNESILHTILADFGHKCSRDKVKTELQWLQEQGLITTSTAAACIIARLTSRGLDVAQGNTTVPGVKRPSPRD